jgi:hypothetical protein
MDTAGSGDLFRDSMLDRCGAGRDYASAGVLGAAVAARAILVFQDGAECAGGCDFHPFVHDAKG